MATIRELVTVLGFKVDTKELDRYHKVVGGIGGGLKKMGGIILAEGAVLFALAKTTASSVAEFKALAQQTGTTTEKFQEMAFAASQSHVEVASMTTGLRILSRHALQAMHGNSESMKLLAQGGITSLYNADGKLKTSDQLLMQIADRFKTMPNNIQKTGLATLLLGRAGASLIPMLNKGSGAMQALADHGRELGVVMGEDAVEKATIFNHAMKEAKAMLLGLKNTLGVELMPVITEVIHKFTAWYEANRKMLIPKLLKFVDELGSSLPGIANAFLDIANAVLKVSEVFGGLGNTLKIIIGLWIAMGIAEAFATGGLSLIASAAAGAAAFGISQYMMSGTGASSSAMSPAQAFSSGGNGMMGLAASNAKGGAGPVQHNYNTYELALPPGTTELHAQEVLKIVKNHDEANMRALAAAANAPAFVPLRERD